MYMCRVHVSVCVCVCARTYVRACVMLNQYKDIVIGARWIQHIMSHHGARARGMMGDVDCCSKALREAKLTLAKMLWLLYAFIMYENGHI